MGIDSGDIYHFCHIITNLQLGNQDNFLTVKTIVSGDVSPIFNSNWLTCSIMYFGDVGWCYWCTVWWSVHILFNERTSKFIMWYVCLWINVFFFIMLEGTFRGRRKVGVGEAKGGYWMLILVFPDDWRNEFPKTFLNK